MIKKILKALGALVALFVVSSLAFIWYIGAWNIVFPSSSHDTVAPEIPDSIGRPAVLLFTKTNSFRHKEAIEVGSRFIKELGEKRAWSVFHTENGAVFNAADLARFDVVMFHNASGDILNDEQEQAFQTWLLEGGGWLGTHAAGDGSHAGWTWYVDKLIGADYVAHIMGPQFQVADMFNEAPTHPVMAGLPEGWQHEEEWYSWEESPRPRGFTILATVDESSYTPVANFAGTETDLRMGDHPIVWASCIGRGRSVYSALGHQASAYDEPNHRRLLENALAWAMDAKACAGESAE